MRCSPSPDPVLITAAPPSFSVVRTSAKSRLIFPSFDTSSAILRAAFDNESSALAKAVGGDADEHIAQSQYIVLKPDQLDDNDLLEKLDKTPAYDRPKDFRDNFDGSEKKEESNGSGRRTIRF